MKDLSYLQGDKGVNNVLELLREELHRALALTGKPSFLQHFTFIKYNNSQL